MKLNLDRVKFSLKAPWAYLSYFTKYILKTIFYFLLLAVTLHLSYIKRCYLYQNITLGINDI